MADAQDLDAVVAGAAHGVARDDQAARVERDDRGGGDAGEDVSEISPETCSIQMPLPPLFTISQSVDAHVAAAAAMH